MEKEKKTSVVKLVAKIVIGSLVELFAGVATNCIVDKMGGSKPAKIGAKAGGIMLGYMLADQVSDHLIDQFDSARDDISEFRRALDEEEHD